MRASMVVIVDYGMGNLGSVLGRLGAAGAKAIVSGDPRTIERAARLVLPGVGSFGAGMNCLASRGLVPVLTAKVLEERTPILGICLGMQLFTRRSEEGNASGLGWLAADTRRFRLDPGSRLRVPHVGWNDITAARTSSLLSGIDDGCRFYFTHSYHTCCDDPSDVLATAHYGYDFPAMVQRDNLYGTQFHPEKSHRQGLRLLANFIGCS